MQNDQTQNDQAQKPLKEYLGIVWIDDKPGLRFTLLAKDANEAGALAEAKYGKHPMSVWNEEDAHRIR